MQRPWFPCVAFLALVFVLAGCGGGAGHGGANALPPTWTVTNLADAGPRSLRDAVQNAPDGAWIVFDTNLATGTITLLSEIVIDRPIVIGGLSGSLERHTISGGNATRLFMVGPGASLDLRDLILSSGNAGDAAVDNGGAIFATASTLALSRVTIVACHAPAASGGALCLTNATLLMVDSAINACTAIGGGAVFGLGSSAHIERCSFHLNTANGTLGGAMRLMACDVRVINSTLNENRTLAGNGVGGGIALTSSAGLGLAKVWLWASTVTDNEASEGGGLYAQVLGGEPCSIGVRYSIVAANSAANAPDILLVDGADSIGSENVIGVGNGSSFFNGFDHNQVGDSFTPLDPQSQGVSFLSYGRAVRTPANGSPARNAVSTAQVLRPSGAPLLLDEQGAARVQGGAPDVGAVEQ